MTQCILTSASRLHDPVQGHDVPSPDTPGIQSFHHAEGVRSDLAPSGEPSPEELASIAAVLARLFGDPRPLGTDEALEAVAIIRQMSANLFHGYESRPEELAVEWNREKELFAGSCGAIRLEESVYKAWTVDESHPLRGTSGLAWGDPAVHMARTLDRFGMALDPAEDPAPDHLAILLEFAGFLLENRSRDEAISFCRDHLDWLGDLRAKLEAEHAPALAEAIESAQELVERITRADVPV